MTDPADAQRRASFDVPQRMLDALEEIGAGTRQPVHPRDAASVILLREGAGGGGAEALLMLRQRSMAFAPGMVTFPGGSVDADDALVALELSAHEAEQWSTALGVDEFVARSVLSAAIRETFEETGVLLASSGGQPIDWATDRWRERRRSVEAHEASWSQLVAETGLALHAHDLRLWSCWVTPVGESRRYRTWFFLATVPADAAIEVVSTEAFRSAWLTPGDALAAFERGEIEMLPPQQLILSDLAAEFRDAPLSRVQAGEHIVQLVEPIVRFGPDGPYLEITPDAQPNR